MAGGLSSALLLLLCGAIEGRTRSAPLDRLGGLAVQAPRLGGFWIFACLAAVGAPLLAGFSAELMLFTGVFAVHPYAAVFVMASTAVSTAALIWSAQRVFLGPAREEFARVRDTTALELGYLWPLVVFLVAFGALAGRVVPVIGTGLTRIAAALGSTTVITNQPLGILLGLLPAVMLAFGALLCAVVAALRPRTRPSLYRWVALLTTVGAFVASVVELLAMRPSADGVGLVTYSGGLIVDRFQVFGTVLVCLVLVLTVLGAEGYMRRVPARAGAFCALLELSAAASVMLLAQREMAAFVAAFALLVVCLTLLTAMTKTSGHTAEAAFRQVLAGGVALATGRVRSVAAVRGGRHHRPQPS